MEYFTEEHSKLLLSKEWLVKVDADKSVPYLMACAFLVRARPPTDHRRSPLSCLNTKTVWAEVLFSNQLFRRWCDANNKPLPSASTSYDEEWKDQVFQLLTDAHTLGGFLDLSFEAVPSHYSDFAFELQHDQFKWRWETLVVGPKLSAELLSKHLIVPLISTAHLAFTSADPVSELADGDLEKVIAPAVTVNSNPLTRSRPRPQAVDKVGRTARRMPDTHVRNAIMRPKVSTTLRRLTALLDFTAALRKSNPAAPPLLPHAHLEHTSDASLAPAPIRSEVDKPDLTPPPDLRAADATGQSSSQRPASRRDRDRDRSSPPPQSPAPRGHLRASEASPEPHDHAPPPPSGPSPTRPRDRDRAISVDEPPENQFAPAPVPVPADDSATESDEPGAAAAAARSQPPPPPPAIAKEKGKGRASAAPSSSSRKRSLTPADKDTTPAAAAARASSPESDVPVARKAPPAKKAKASASSSDTDEDAGGGAPKNSKTAKRGTRQPIRRGGRRFVMTRGRWSVPVAVSSDLFYVRYLAADFAYACRILDRVVQPELWRSESDGCAGWARARARCWHWDARGLTLELIRRDGVGGTGESELRAASYVRTTCHLSLASVTATSDTRRPTRHSRRRTQDSGCRTRAVTESKHKDDARDDADARCIYRLLHGTSVQMDPEPSRGFNINVNVASSLGMNVLDLPPPPRISHLVQGDASVIDPHSHRGASHDRDAVPFCRAPLGLKPEARAGNGHRGRESKPIHTHTHTQGTHRYRYRVAVAEPRNPQRAALARATRMRRELIAENELWIMDYGQRVREESEDSMAIQKMSEGGESKAGAGCRMNIGCGMWGVGCERVEDEVKAWTRRAGASVGARAHGPPLCMRRTAPGGDSIRACRRTSPAARRTANARPRGLVHVRGAERAGWRHAVRADAGRVELHVVLSMGTRKDKDKGKDKGKLALAVRTRRAAYTAAAILVSEAALAGVSAVRRTKAQGAARGTDHSSLHIAVVTTGGSEYSGVQMQARGRAD
ncbi:hypothetical protein EVG20_g6593 [Dentipellis fragilis]|uniref:Uncharacterized protein n=1 Tax=Dentipellis fragilis TaxID=205917 RepID=A0A4Y9YM18_9AGAM|nr:hypothetical protein EVG20_g6593 [Dentipellis fragilis]